MLLVLQCRLASGKPLLIRHHGSICQKPHPCKKEKVLNQIRCQVSNLNMTALDLFDFYVSFNAHLFHHTHTQNPILCMSTQV